METTDTPIEGLKVIHPQIFEDSRGYFFESYNKEKFERANISANFVQDNESLSQKNVLRGLHFQNPPWEQGKLVRVIKGAVLDVVVDVRKNARTYGSHFSIELSEENKTMLWIPPGFAHGFLTLRDNTIFSYKCSQFYNQISEDGILWNDPELNIDWGISDPILSEKDRKAKKFAQFSSLF